MDNKIVHDGNLLGYSLSKKDVKKLFFSSPDRRVHQIDTVDVYSGGKYEEIIVDLIFKDKRRDKLKVFTKAETIRSYFKNQN